MTHNEAILICLLRHSNEWVSLDELQKFTKTHCRSRCNPINSRASDLRNKYGYTVYNKTEMINGLNYSSYKIAISQEAKNQLRKLYLKKKKVIHYSEVLKSLQPQQASMYIHN
jgi:hypothetical protein